MSASFTGCPVAEIADWEFRGLLAKKRRNSHRWRGAIPQLIRQARPQKDQDDGGNDCFSESVVCSAKSVRALAIRRSIVTATKYEHL